MSEQKPSLPLEAFIAGSRIPDGKDLADMEAHVDALEAERAAIEGQKFLVLGRKKAALEKANAELGRWRLGVSVAREHVFASQAKLDVYQNIKANEAKQLAREQARKDGLKKAKQVELERTIQSASMGVAETAGQPPAEAAPSKRAALKEYMKGWDKKSQTEKEIAQARLLEDEREP